MALGLLVLGLGFAPSAAAQDLEPPVIEILESGVALEDGALFARAVLPTIVVTDASPTTVSASVDGVELTSGQSVAGEGLHQLSVSATDDAGNSAQAMVSFRIDTLPPTFHDLSPADGALTTEAAVTLTGRVVGAASLTVDGAAISLSGEQWSAGPFTLAEGARTFQLVATDAAGNSATLDHRVVRDSTPPSLSIALPAADAVLGTVDVTVSGSVDDPHLESVIVGAQPALRTGSTWVAERMPLAEGMNLFSITATDAAGNVRSLERNVVRDTSPPEIQITDPAPGTVVPDASITLSGVALDPHLASVSVNGVVANLGADGAWSVTVPLSSGANDLVARAVDSLGWSAEGSVSVVRDDEAPEIRITEPADGIFVNGPIVTVKGTVEDQPGLEVSVNGESATVAGGLFEASAVDLVEGENRLIARVVDSLGNQGAHTRIVHRDGEPPQLLSSSPSTGALALPVSSSFEVTFSEPLGPLAASAWRLRTAGGQSLPADAEVMTERLQVTPSQPLPAQTGVELVLTGDLVDRAGNRLPETVILEFTTEDDEAPATPSLDLTPPAWLCAEEVSLQGTAEAGATIDVVGGAAGATARVDSAGAFSVEVALLPERLHHLAITALDISGNRSPALEVSIGQDCRGPRVVGARLESGAIVIDFDEVVTGVDGATSISAAGLPVPGTATIEAGGRRASWLADGTLPEGALRLEVATTIRDRADNALAYPFVTVLGGEVTSSFLAGRVLDDHTGRPLAGATVAVIASDGALNPEPVPEQTVGADGGFRIPVAAGSHFLTITRAGYSPVFRQAAAVAGGGADVFDPRLTPLGVSAAAGVGGASLALPAGPRLEIPSGALGAEIAATLTALSEQALPASLPLGYAPRGAVWVELGDAVLTVAGALDLPVAAADGTVMIWVHLDPATLTWQVLEEQSVDAGELSLGVDTGGAYVAVEADGGALAPPPPIVGDALAAAPSSSGEVLSASVVFDPATVLPTQWSTATVSYGVTGDISSGTPLTLEVRERLDLLDGTVEREAPYSADLLLFQASDGTPRSQFRLMPSPMASAVALEMGVEDVTVRAYGGETLQGGVLGPLGGTVATPEGDRLDIPAGALDGPAAVGLERVEEADLAAVIPAPAEWLGALRLDLGDRRLGLDATLSLELGGPPAAVDGGLLLESVTSLGQDLYRVAARLEATASGWRTAAIDPADLPWPGVRGSGSFVFVRVPEPLAFARGSVLGVDGQAFTGALVSRPAADGWDWVQLSAEDGSYALPIPLGAVSLQAVDPAAGNRGEAGGVTSAAEERLDLDLSLLATGPRVLEVVPAAAAVDVPSGIEPTVRFSEPVDPTTLPQGIQLALGGEAVPVDFEVQGELVRLLPAASLVPGALYEIRIGSAVRDFQGYRLEEITTSTFRVLEAPELSAVDFSEIFLIEPDGAGLARVLGRPGAAPAGSLVFAENLSRQITTVSIPAAPDGSFEVDFEATLEDSVLLHVLIEGQNEVVAELTPFLSADGRTAYIGTEAVSFTTFDGFTLSFEDGSFDRRTTVRLEPREAADFRPALPPELRQVLTFELDYGGATLLKKPLIRLPAPADLTRQELLLAGAWRLLGRHRWMLMDLFRLEGDVLTTEPAAGDLVQIVTEPELAAKSLAEGPPTKARPGDRREYLPGAANPGLYTVLEPTVDVGLVALPWAGINTYFEFPAIQGMVSVINGAISRLLEFDAVLVPLLGGEIWHLKVRDLTTGFELFEGQYDPPPPGELVILEENYGDVEAPIPVAGAPLSFHVLEGVVGIQELRVGLTAEVERGVDETEGTAVFMIQVDGEEKQVDPRAEVCLKGLEGDELTCVEADEQGGFSLLHETELILDSRYLLALGAVLEVDEGLSLTFSEPLGAKILPTGERDYGIRVKDALNRPLTVEIETAADSHHVEIVPPYGWRAGERYTLELLPEVADRAGNKWGEKLVIRFDVGESRVLDTYDGAASVRDVARLGALLFVAADEDGLEVVDITDPTELVNFLPEDGHFGLPFSDPVRGVDVDPHGRVVLVGGGVDGPGLLRLLDVVAMSEAVADGASLQTVKEAALLGSTRISDALTGTGTSLPEGTPRGVEILSDDASWRWRAGWDTPEDRDGLSVTGPEEDPNFVAGDGAFTMTLSAPGNLIFSSPYAGRPVTLHNRTRGSFVRVDAEPNGAFTLQAEVHFGDTLELLRNRHSLAYVAILGAGIAEVDLAEIYRNPDENETAVREYWTGASEDTGETLELCGEATPHVGGALLDVGLLIDDRPLAAHPLVMASLISFRGLSLVDYDSDRLPHFSFLSEACANVGGSRRVRAMEVIEDYYLPPKESAGESGQTPQNLSPGGAEKVALGETQGLLGGPIDPTTFPRPERALRDLIVISHAQAGLLIFDVENREEPALIGRVPFPAGLVPGGLGFDRGRRRLYVAASGGKLVVVDFSHRPVNAEIDRDGDGRDDRLLEILPLGGASGADAPVFLVPELGLAFAGGSSHPLTSVKVGDPTLAVVRAAGDADAAFERLDEIKPLGTRTTTDTATPDTDPRARGLFHIFAALPGRFPLGSELKAEVMSMGPSFEEIRGAGDPSLIPDLPGTALRGEDAVELERLSEQPYGDGFLRYLSKPILPLADLRAATDYERLGEELDPSVCVNCQNDKPIYERAEPILSGHFIGFRLDEAAQMALETIYEAPTLERLQTRVESVPWDISPAARQEPVLSASRGVGDVPPGTLLHSGEIAFGVADLTLRGRGLDFVLTRSYRSQTVGNGPFGPGWDHNYNIRLRRAPNGNVELFDGTGRRETLTLTSPEGQPEVYDPPPGRFLRLDRTAAGYVLINPQRFIYHFDRFGRLVSITDPVKDGEATGTEKRFFYDLKSQLVRIAAHERELLLEYDDGGRITSLEDHTGRKVSYVYDSDGRLERVESPPVQLKAEDLAVPLVTTYSYETFSGDLDDRLNDRDNLATQVDPEGEDWWRVLYGDADTDGRSQELTYATWGGDEVLVDYVFGDDGTVATVTDRRGKIWTHRHNADGHRTLLLDPDARSLEIVYNHHGIPVRTESPSGGQVEVILPDEQDDPLAWGNVSETIVSPNVLGGTNGSADQLRTATADYGAANRPQLVVDPRGMRTLMSRDESGRPLEVHRSGGAQTATTRYTYNDYGQPLSLQEPDGEVTEFEYEDEAPRLGFLKSVIVDTGGQSLETRYETDERGNVVEVIDPEGVRHRFVYNDLDWLVQERYGDGAGPGEATTPDIINYHYDSNGRVVEVERGAGDGGESSTSTRFTYGVLGELLTESRQIAPGSTSWQTITRRYDRNRNLVEEIRPNLQTTRFVYDARNLPIEITHAADTPQSQVERFEYDPDGRMTRHVDGLGHAWETLYDGYGRVEEIKDPLGQRTTVSYDNGGLARVTRSFDATGILLAESEVFYDQLGRSERQIQRLWNYDPTADPEDGGGEVPPGATEISSQTTYSPGSRVLSTTDPRGFVTHYRYDTAGRLREIEDAMGNRVERQLDRRGDVLSETRFDALADGGLASVTEQYRYDALGRVISTTDGLGQTTHLAYDVRGNRRRVTDAEGHVTSFEYDGLDRLTRQVQPAGRVVSYEYDASSRPTAMIDALGNQTLWLYDALDRPTQTIYQDGTSFTTEYDAGDRPIRQVHASGTVVNQTFDDADRLTARTVVPAGALVGPTAESYAYDGLNRVVRAENGTVVTERTYDSLSRLLTEKVGGRQVSHNYDAASLPVSTSYPSSRLVSKQRDPLGRLSAIRWAGALISEKAQYGYRGTSLVEKKALGSGDLPALVGTTSFDAIGRPAMMSFHQGESFGQGQVFGQSLAYSARGLLDGEERADWNGVGFSYNYDGAGRLTAATRVQGAAGANERPAGLFHLPKSFSMSHDGADNLLAIHDHSDCGVAEHKMPLEASGRNRPASVDGAGLTWDANGNLVAKGDLVFAYDYRDRLTQVRRGEDVIADYEYDAQNRRVKRVVDGQVRETVWSGWRPIEEYVNGSLHSRRTYGVGLDEIVSLEIDPELDGTFNEYLPVYDALGNMAMVTDEEGFVVEKYAYSPFGDRWVLTDSIPPSVQQWRVVGDEIWIELSEEVELERLQWALEDGDLDLSNLTTGEPVSFSLSVPVQEGRSARRRLVLREEGDPEHSHWPATGESLGIVLRPEVLFDLFGNVAAAEGGLDDVVVWPAGDQVFLDNAPPELVRACVLADGRLAVELSEPVDLTLASHEIRIDGAVTTWIPGGGGYVLYSASALEAGSHFLDLSTEPLDHYGLGLETAFAESFTVEGGRAAEVYVSSVPGITTASTIGNEFGFHGLPFDAETGLFYVRNRYYDPELGRFISTDPLGYVDGPNLYQFALNDPVNLSDPTGEAVTVVGLLVAGVGSMVINALIAEALDVQYDGADAGIDAVLGMASLGLGSAVKTAVLAKRLTRGGGVASIIIGESVAAGAGESLRASLHGRPMSAGQTVQSGVVGGLFASMGARGAVATGASRNTAVARALSECFVAGTLVWTADGLRVPIEQIEVGDEVLSRHPETGEISVNRVAEVFVNEDKAILEIEVESSTGEIETFQTTHEHPFFVEDGRQVLAQDLQPGDRLAPTVHGETGLTVRQVRGSPGLQTVYNFEVENDHTYFVGEQGVWVHNTCKKIRSEPGFVSGFREIREKSIEARSGDIPALGEIQAAKILRAEGRNVHFQTPKGRRGPGTADFLVGGERGTGVGGAVTDIFTPRSRKAQNVFLGIAKKNDQAPNIIVNLINNADVRAIDLGSEADILRNVREILEPQGIKVNIRSVRVLDK